MTDSAYGFGYRFPGVSQATGVSSAAPIPPPASVGGPPAPPSYAPPHGVGAAPAPTRPTSSRGHLGWVLVLAVAIAAAAFALSGAFKSGSAVTTIQAPQSAAGAAQAQAGLRNPGIASVSGQAPFVLHYPKGWTRLTSAQLAKIANVPAAGLVAEGGRDLLLVRPKKPLTQSLPALSTELTRSLSSRFADFRLLSTGTIRTLAGPAWVYTFERSRHGLVQSEVVVSTGSVAYEIDIALRSGANRAATEISEIVRSFQT